MNEIIVKIKNNRLWVYLIIAFIAGVVCTGLFLTGQRSARVGKLDQRYDNQHRNATEIIGRLEAELERERDINIRLREQNTRARELTEGLTSTTNRNVRDLQAAVSLISEIRAKVKILEDFYNSGNSGDGGN